MPLRFRELVVEMHRRSLWQVLGIYFVGAWICYEVVLGLTEGLGLPDWVPPMAVILFIIGLPVVLATAFIQEGLPGQRGSPAPAPAPAPASASSTIDDDGAGLPGGAAAPPSTAPRSGRRLPRLFTWRRAIAGGVIAFALLGLASAGFMAMRSMGVGPVGSLVGKGELAPQDPVLVAEFAPLTGDTALARVITEAMRVDLSQSALLSVVDRSMIAHVLGRMGRDRATPLERDIAREVAVRMGLKAIVEGEVGTAGGQYLLAASLVTPDSGRVLASFRETAADSTQLLPSIDRLSRRLREKAGESLSAVRASPPLTQVTTSSLPALRRYVASRDAETRGDRPTAMRLMSQALELDPDFANAHRSMAVYMYNTGLRTDTMFAHARRAVELGDRLTDHERHHARGSYALASHDLGPAIEEYRTLLAIDSTDHVALINLGHLLDLRGEYAETEELTKRAAEIGFRAINTTYWNLNRALYAQGKYDEAVEWIERARADYPESGTPRSMRWLVEVHRGDYDAALAALDPEEDSWPRMLHQLVRGRVSAAARIAESEDDAPLGAGARQAVFQALHAAYAGHWIMQRPDAVDGLLRVLEDALLDTVPPDRLPLPHAAVLVAAAGRSDEARELVRRFRDRVIPEILRQHESMLLLAEGLADVTDGRQEQGFATLERAQRLALCPACYGAHIGRAYEQAGRTAEAIDWYTRYLETPWADRFDPDPGLPAVGVWLQAPTHERLARLLEDRGDRASAAGHYAAFVDMWQDADPALQPRVRAARRALERLTAERPPAS